MKTQFAIVASIAAIFNSASGFAPVLGVSKTSSTSRIPQGTTYIDSQHPVAVQRQRKSVASVQTMGLFGLGAPEIAVILVAGAFLLGPQKLAELGKEAGKMAGELKEVPKEFQEGLAEGEKQAQQMKKELRLDSKVEDAEKE
jgi:sec-independent protein translocase protein TatA